MKGGEIMSENLIGSVGRRIVKIDCEGCDFTIKKLSELGDNWSISSECPSCNRKIIFTKNNVNKLFYCECGQKIKLEILEELL